MATINKTIVYQREAAIISKEAGLLTEFVVGMDLYTTNNMYRGLRSVRRSESFIKNVDDKVYQDFFKFLSKDFFRYIATFYKKVKSAGMEADDNKLDVDYMAEGATVYRLPDIKLAGQLANKVALLWNTPEYENLSSLTLLVKMIKDRETAPRFILSPKQKKEMEAWMKKFASSILKNHYNRIDGLGNIGENMQTRKPSYAEFLKSAQNYIMDTRSEYLDDDRTFDLDDALDVLKSEFRAGTPSSEYDKLRKDVADWYKKKYRR